MRRFIQFASVTTLLTLATPAVASWCPSSYEASAEFLYWRPCLQDLYFTILGPDLGSSVSTPTGVELSVCQDYQPGVRAAIGGSWGCGDRGVRLQWEFLSADDSRRVTIGSDQVLWVTRTSPDIPNTGDSPYDEGSAFSQVKTHYYALDLEGWRDSRLCGPFAFTGLVGIRWAAARYDQFVLYSDLEHEVETNLRDNARVWGVGPYLGLKGRYCLCGGLSLRAAVSGGLLAGGITSGSRQSDPGNSFVDRLAVDREWVCHTIPLVAMKVGVDYCLPICKAKISAGIFYDMVRYFDAIQRIRFPDSEAEGINTLTNTPLSFEGLSVAFGIDY